MNKNIIYQGHSTVPSDYRCQDGELALSLNLINEEGALRPVFSPTVKASLRDKTDRLLCIHKISGQPDHYICAGHDGRLYWFSINPQETESAYHDITADSPSSICAIGNILVLLSQEVPMTYAKWNPDASSYIFLGERPPFVNIEFGLHQTMTRLDKTTDIIISDCSPGIKAFFNKYEEVSSRNLKSSDATASEKKQISDAVFAVINRSMAKAAVSSRFTMPFFVRYAFRLFDGSHAWHSAPVLMLPCTGVPYVRMRNISLKDSLLSISLGDDYIAYSLYHRILPKDLGALAAWEDIIAGIDIFVSAPVYTFKSEDDISLVSAKYVTDHIHNWGHYCDSYEDGYQDYSHDPAPGSFGFIPPAGEQLSDRLTDISNFYKIAHIPFKEIIKSSFTELLTAVNIEPSDLQNLLTRSTLKDDYQSHSSIAPSTSYAFNGRLNVADILYTPAPPFFMRIASAVSLSSSPTLERVNITVFLRKNGQIIARSLPDYSNEPSLSNVSFSDSLKNGAFPRWLFYPDTSAFRLLITQGSDSWDIPLKPHDFLSGAYWIDESINDALTQRAPDSSDNPISTTIGEETPPATSVRLGNKLYTSEVNNPFYFPVTSINTVNVARILALSSAARPLSQGQFGQFPLYVFTDEGIWALETSAQGSYLAKQPITRDICSNPSAITQIDSAVLFPTLRGIMQISGSQTQCISDHIASESPIDIRALPYFIKLLKSSGINEEIQLLPFSKFLEECSMLYDYIDQRIILFSSNASYAYLYSLKSGMWGMMKADICHRIDAYPHALAVSHEGKIIEFSTENSAANTPGVILTRPLQFDLHDTLKTVRSIIQRGHFRKGNVQSILYGSRDLYNWHLVWSSKDHYLRGFSGTPYKYFRIACLTSLSKTESLSGASAELAPRQTNIQR